MMHQNDPWISRKMFMLLWWSMGCYKSIYSTYSKSNENRHIRCTDVNDKYIIINVIIRRFYASDSRFNIILEPGRVFAAIASVYPFILGLSLFVSQVGETDDSTFSVPLVTMVVLPAAKGPIDPFYRWIQVHRSFGVLVSSRVGLIRPHYVCRRNFLAKRISFLCTFPSHIDRCKLYYKKI